MQKPIGIFMADEQAIRRAYMPQTRALLAQYLDLRDAFRDADAFPDGWDREVLRQAEYVFSTWGMPCLDETQIRRELPRLKAVFYAAGSVQTFARPFLRCGVQVFSARSANAIPVAQTVVSEIVLSCKGFFHTVHCPGKDAWTKRPDVAAFPGAYGTRIGILGAGQIGRLVIDRLREMALQPVVYDPYLSDADAVSMGAEKAQTLQEVFSTCFVISNHLPDLPATRGVLDKTCFSCMGKTAVFLNTGRGRQVAEADLIAALREAPGRVAVLDVTYPEPPQPDSALYALPNVFLTPHLAGSIGDEVGRMGEYMARECLALLRGEPTRFAVTPEMLDIMA